MADLRTSGYTHLDYNCLLPNEADRSMPVTSANPYGRNLTDIDMQIDPIKGNSHAGAKRRLIA